ncbi:hypothetical protein KSP39_PZI016805 [Platanthera zijinensis]|uniref:Putative plant transposon protein domain-containing protein n=1 Tax=Platanthera zijinensis TaxID=2320716 RepID=A0AAP0G0V9_9ASPA
MAPKSRDTEKGKDKIRADFRFLTEEAFTRYEALKSTPLIYERGFKILNQGVGLTYVNKIQSLKWDTFCQHKVEAVQSWVFEFYAHARFAEGDKVFVRGKRVSFSPRVINEYFDLEDYHPDEYSSIHDLVTPEGMAALLCAAPGPNWSNPTKFVLKTNCLSRIAKVWLLFVNASIMPTKHANHISLDKLALLYCIVSGRKIDVGKVIFQMIQSKAREEKVRQLWFPVLITELCRCAGVIPLEGDMVTMVGHPIAEIVITTNIKVPSDGFLEKIQEKEKASQPLVPEDIEIPLTDGADTDQIMENIEYLKAYQRCQHLYVESNLSSCIRIR